MLKKVITIIVGVFFVGYLIPLFLIISHRNSKITTQVDYLIVLGAKVNDNHPSKMLKNRLDSARQYYEEHRDVKIIVTGGQGVDELYPEAEVMKNYLVNNGVPKQQIIEENKSTNTFENLTNAKQIIDKNSSYNYQVGVVTNGFHVYRSSLLCKRVFNQKCHVLGAESSAGIVKITSFLREPLALYKSFFFDK